MSSPSKYSVWSNLSLLTALCMMVACSPLQQKRRIPECSLVFEQIEKCWVKDPVSGLHHLTAGATSEYGFGSSKNDECFKGLAPKDIERLFGKSDTVLNGSMIYFMTQPCLEKAGTKANGCHFLVCAFAAEGVVQRLNLLTTRVNIDYLAPNQPDGPKKE